MRKKYWILAVIVILLTTAFAPYVKHQVGENLTVNNVAVIVPPIGYRMLAFYDKETEKIGFCSNSGSFQVLIPAEYDEALNGRYKLMAVKKNGRWGAVELSLNNSLVKDQPVIPCEFTSITIISDTEAEVVRPNGGRSRISIQRR